MSFLLAFFLLQSPATPFADDIVFALDKIDKEASHFFKVKGVNLNYAEFEEALYRVPDLRDYQVLVTAGDRLQLRLECVDGSAAQVREAVDRLLKEWMPEK